MGRIPAILLAIAGLAFPATWDTLDRELKSAEIEVGTRDGKNIRGQFVAVTPEAIAVRGKKGEQSIAKADVRRVAVRDPGRRMRNGLIATGAGLGAGVAIGLAVCPHCANEGNGGKFVGPGAAIGAAIGALGFLPAPYRTVYKSK